MVKGDTSLPETGQIFFEIFEGGVKIDFKILEPHIPPRPSELTLAANQKPG